MEISSCKMVTFIQIYAFSLSLSLEDEKLLSSERKHALIVDGASLAYAMVHHQEKLREICEQCVTVLCCRMTPIQKAEVSVYMSAHEQTAYNEYIEYTVMWVFSY